mgnify:CR=1 FL=1
MCDVLFLCVVRVVSVCSQCALLSFCVFWVCFFMCVICAFLVCFCTSAVCVSVFSVYFLWVVFAVFRLVYCVASCWFCFSLVMTSQPRKRPFAPMTLEQPPIVTFRACQNNLKRFSLFFVFSVFRKKTTDCHCQNNIKKQLTTNVHWGLQFFFAGWDL